MRKVRLHNLFKRVKINGIKRYKLYRNGYIYYNGLEVMKSEECRRQKDNLNSNNVGMS